MYWRSWPLLFVGVVLATLLPFRSAAAAPLPAGDVYRYYPETGHSIVPPISLFFSRQGDVPAFGLPLTDLVVVDGREVQYFERARIELTRDPVAGVRIELGLLGRELVGARHDGPFAPPSGVPADARHFEETGHTIRGAFRTYWETSGGLPRFGLPISKEFSEAHGNQQLTVQYFERARFEWHPDVDGGKVLLGLIGREYAERGHVPSALLAPSSPLSILAQARVSFPDRAAARQNVALAAERLHGLTVAPGGHLSFLNAVAPLTTAAGYATDEGIEGGRVVETVAGGICYTASALFQAVFAAGFPIHERRSHSVLLRSMAAMPGMDAAVATPGPDLVWQNDSTSPVILGAVVVDAQVVVTFWGSPDRQVRVGSAARSNPREPGQPELVVNPALRPGEERTVRSAQAGMDIVVPRTVIDLAGALLWRDQAWSRYNPVPALVEVGPETSVTAP